MKCSLKLFSLAAVATALHAVPIADAANGSHNHWITAWTAMPQLTEYSNLPNGVYNASSKFFNTTIRQTIKIDLPGAQTSGYLRLRISNRFGTSPLNVTAVAAARPLNNTAGRSEIDTATNQHLSFNKGSDAGVLIPPGSLAVSDPFMFDFSNLTTYASNGTMEAGSLLSVSMYLAQGQDGDAITSHPGSRVNSYLVHGNQVDAANVTGSDVQVLAHWYFISAVKSWSRREVSSLVIVGDSITDGRGSDTNLNNRWPDILFSRLETSSANLISVANQAAGGNRILADGLGPSALSRIDRDVLAQSGVKYAMIFEGVNDIGTAPTDEASQAIVYHQLIAAYRQIIARVHAQGIPMFGATITPFGSPNTTLQPYSDPVREQTRMKVNEWIRSSGEFDAVIDFDAAVKDPKNAKVLDPRYNSGDYLHLNIEGYRVMADTVSLGLFSLWQGGYSGFL